ncbi:MAG TPA: DUF58 domain-containing protein [Candidatus Ozemobacteraceae bacterium]|nr:DUF58 domain-containing protein [Candidatus Ozemobacteraceae bacterium]
MKRSLHIEITPAGALFIFLGGFLAVAATNTGNNLLFLIATGIFALLLMSLVGAVLNVSSLDIAWSGCLEGFAGEALRLPLRIHETSGRGRLQLFSAGFWITKLMPWTRAEFIYPLPPRSRGRYVCDDLTIRSNFPFGLFRILRSLPRETLWIYPSPRFAGASGTSELAALSAEGVHDPRGDFWMTRPYEACEEARHIHWPISARLDQVMTTMRTIPRSDPLRVWLDTAGFSESEVEAFLGKVAGLVLESSQSHQALLVWCDDRPKQPEWVAAGIPDGNRRILQYLAGRLWNAPALEPQDLNMDDRMTGRLRPSDFSDGAAP